LQTAGFIVGVVACLGVIGGLEFPSVANGIYVANAKQNWVLGVLIAAIVLGTSAEQFWRFRQFNRVWAVLATYLVLHFLIAVPALGRHGYVVAGHIEELYLFLFAIAEGVAVHLVLSGVTGSLPIPDR